jgi:hypothetical protein
MRDIDVRTVMRTGVAIALVVAGVVAAVLGSLHVAGIAPGGERLDLRDAPQGAPGLSSAPQPELQQGRREKEARLHSAGWVDREAGIAHIPIEDAMDILASQAEGRR